MLSEATQKNHEIDFTTIPILQMEKPGFRKELTGQAARKWQNLDLNLGDIFLVVFFCDIRTFYSDMCYF